MEKVIRISGARQHNLKNLTLEIPKEKLVVVTGPSGSGKSSLAFNTLYAEGQRRYVESLSTYARQFLDQLEKPDVDSIDGLSPAVAIDQKSGSGNPRSTISTTTEIHDFLRILWAAIGIPHDPETGEALEKMGTVEIVNSLMSREGAKVILLAPVPKELWPDGLRLVEDLQRQGFIRVRINSEIFDIEEAEQNWPEALSEFEVVVDRLVVREGGSDRLADSVETALRICGAEARALIQMPDADEWEEQSFVTAYRNPTTGFELPQLTPKCFSFNGQVGACPACHGLGTETYADPGLIVPDQTKSLDEGAILIWKAAGKQKQSWQTKQALQLAAHFSAARDVAFSDLDAEFKTALFYGTGDEDVTQLWEKDGDARTFRRPYEGLCNQAERLFTESESDAVRRVLSKFMATRVCRLCAGGRLKREFLAVKVRNGDSALGISDFCEFPVAKAYIWMETLKLPAGREKVLGRVLDEVRSRLGFLHDVGLDYLTLSRTTATLSGGEFQRIRLSTQLGAGLSGVLYVLDEPSIGLHQADNERLIQTLFRLRDIGNTVVVVEHDEDTIRAADWVLDIGPGAGQHGGELMAEGTPEDIAQADTPTGLWLRGETPFEFTRQKTGKETKFLEIKGAKEHNLQDIDVSIPLGLLVSVTGSSGSGKSTLIDTILKRALQRKLHRAKATPGKHREIVGLENVDRLLVVDQSSLGGSPRSNAATFTGLMDLLRELFAKLPLARERGYGSGRFSFNVKGGRCERCQGAGLVKIDMHFLNDAFVTCDLCEGRRYNRETLDVRYKGHDIAALLGMTVEEALEVLATVPKIRAILEKLRDVGLGYLHLGQPANTLSGGEAQRIRLATELSKTSPGHVLYLLDEPTTGLHYQDVRTLMGVLMALRDAGNTVLVVEHNLDVIAVSDWVIDLGPGGGEHGGQLVAEGPPEEIAKCSQSLTGKWLAKR